jgi:hypothetical protein
MYNIGPDDYPIDCIRLRTMYSEGILGDVLQPERTLNSLGFSSKKVSTLKIPSILPFIFLTLLPLPQRVYLDIKEPGEDFPPTEWNSYRVRVFDPENRTFKSFVYVFSADTCTIGELKVILEKKFGISKEKQRVTWSTTPPQELVTDETLCSREIRDGAVLYLESTSETEKNPDSPPLAFSEIERQQTWITLNFNIPPSREHDQLITVNKDLTLREFREKMQKVGVSSSPLLLYSRSRPIPARSVILTSFSARQSSS